MPVSADNSVDTDLLEHLHKLLLVELLINPLNGRQCLATSTLLDADVRISETSMGAADAVTV
jgi:hypothetical protein